MVVAELISDVPKKLIARAAKDRDLLTDQAGPAESKLTPDQIGRKNRSSEARLARPALANPPPIMHLESVA
jgi:hypothetical protein